MSFRSSRADDALFIAAFAAVLVGTGLLLRTTGVARSAFYLWPLIIMAAGAFLLYLVILHKASNLVFFGGLFFTIGGSIILADGLCGWLFSEDWPFFMVAAGISWLGAGLRVKHGIKAFFAVPAFSFIILGLLFSLFSFGLVGMSFRRFISLWWPSIIILGGAALFAAYGVSRRRRRGHPDLS